MKSTATDTPLLSPIPPATSPLLALRLRPCETEDVETLYVQLTEEDRKEIHAINDRPAKAVIEQGVRLSSPFVWVWDDPEEITPPTPVFMCGVNVCPDECGDNVGVAWMIPTTKAASHLPQIRETLKGALPLFFKVTGIKAIAGRIPSNNADDIAWLQSLGAGFPHQNIPMGKDGRPSHIWVIINPHFRQSHLKEEQ